MTKTDELTGKEGRNGLASIEDVYTHQYKDLMSTIKRTRKTNDRKQ